MHIARLVTLIAFLLLLSFFLQAQDASTAAIRGTVADSSSARIAHARVTVTNMSTSVAHTTVADNQGNFSMTMLAPGAYEVRAEADGMAPETRTGIEAELGGSVELHFKLNIAPAQETITVTEGVPVLEIERSDISQVLDERGLTELPLNGRRFADLTLLTPNVTEDPRGQTSESNGDLAFGGVRGFHTSFLVDGADNNNGFFSQARGRYRAPYQFSNEVIQEFRVSSNNYGAELGRGAAVINVVTKSGSNYTHGSVFYYIRDSALNAQQPFTESKPENRQQQFGGTVGGPILKNRAFYFLGFDQHVFHVPTVVQFVNGSSTIVPTQSVNGSTGDYEVCDPRIGGLACDQSLVMTAAQKLNRMSGTYPASLLGNAGFGKLDWTLSPRSQLSMRVNTSRFWGANNVYFDPADPITTYAISNNGSESVATESAIVSLTSGLGVNTVSHWRLQFSRDLQQSSANSTEPLQKIYGIIDGIGEATILPRETREHRLHMAETISRDSGRHQWKFGGEALVTWTRDYFPSVFNGEYEFDDVRVNPWTFVPNSDGLDLTPLRAYAHQVPRYYFQSFGDPVSHPNSNEYAWFAEDTIRMTNHFALTLGLRYDRQTLGKAGLISTPLWPQAGKLPTNNRNFAPRLGFAYSIGDNRPLVVRGGWGVFYTRIPQMYSSAVATNNGVTNSFLFLDSKYAAAMSPAIFPVYPSPLVVCPTTGVCAPPAGLASALSLNPLAGNLTKEVSAFAPNFHTPYLEEASLGLEKELGRKFVLGANYLYVHGVHLIRTVDVNLPPPIPLTYPVFTNSNASPVGYYAVNSFVGWQTTGCPYSFNPCLAPLVRPIPQLGAINQFNSDGISIYHGLSILARRQITRGLYFRLSYTWSHAIDNHPDAMVTAPSSIQNMYLLGSERGNSVTDQRHRVVFSLLAEPQPFRGEHAPLQTLFDNWKWSSTTMIGSGRPYTAYVSGDPNQDGNSSNDRLPGINPNSFTGPAFVSTNMRLARKLQLSERWRMELLAECFNTFNRDNLRIPSVNSGSGYGLTIGEFVNYSMTVGGKHYPGYFQLYSPFQAKHSFAPRQVQLAMRLAF